MLSCFLSFEHHPTDFKMSVEIFVCGLIPTNNTTEVNHDIEAILIHQQPSLKYTSKFQTLSEGKNYIFLKFYSLEDAYVAMDRLDNRMLGNAKITADFSMHQQARFRSSWGRTPARGTPWWDTHAPPSRVDIPDGGHELAKDFLDNPYNPYKQEAMPPPPSQVPLPSHPSMGPQPVGFQDPTYENGQKLSCGDCRAMSQARRRGYPNTLQGLNDFHQDRAQDPAAGEEEDWQEEEEEEDYMTPPSSSSMAGARGRPLNPKHRRPVQFQVNMDGAPAARVAKRAAPAVVDPFFNNENTHLFQSAQGEIWRTLRHLGYEYYPVQALEFGPHTFKCQATAGGGQVLFCSACGARHIPIIGLPATCRANPTKPSRNVGS